ncbi:MAG TPA: hypothetical protein VEU62_01870, partial [Bryobacterales bacterium]|nr:hypothetical protein [Bryobacterales bacterium]
WLVVAAPAIQVSTNEAYRRLGANLTTGSWEDKIDRFCSSVCAPERGAPAAAREQVVAGLENDFEPVVFQMHPELVILKERLQRLGASPALLSGSGSALFGVFVDRRQALRARDSLDLEDGRCFVVKTVSRAGYRARWRKWLSEVKPAR